MSEFCIYCQAGYPPVIIRKQDRLMYYDCLQMANEGDTRPFIRFIAHCTEKTIDVYLWATKEVLPKIGQENEKSDTTTSKRKKDAPHFTEEDQKKESTYVMPDRVFSDDEKEEIKKFSFESADDVPQWQMEKEQHYTEKSQAGGGREGEGQNYIPTNVEDDILKEDNIHSGSDHEVEHEDYKGYNLWFASDEDHATVSGSRRYGRVLNEQTLFEEIISINDKKQNDYSINHKEDEETIPRSL